MQVKRRSEQKTKFGRQKLGLNSKISLTFGAEQLYKGSIYIGESNQEVEVIYDTGSDWLVVEGRDCDDCLGGRYDPNTSSYFSENDFRLRELEYGSFVHVKGKEVQD